MARIQLDVKDRLLLSNQYKILEALFPDEAEDYARSRKIVENGWELSYDWILGPIDSNPMDEEDCTEVFDILEMHRHLLDSYAQLEGKDGIDERPLRFYGFDGNNEAEYLGYAKFLHDEGKYVESAPVNSHMPTLDVYRRMMAVWQPLKHKERLSKDDIQRIMAARVHPDQR